MSWIGGLNDSFSQLTKITGQVGGQLSSFTKEVLAEGTDDVLDFEAEVRRLRMKLIEIEAIVNEKETEIAKHVQSNSVLHEKARTAQLEASSLAHEYQTKLQQQKKIIDKLKHESGNGSSEDGFQILREDDFRHPSPSRRTLSGGSADAAEFDDVINAQREINRLSDQLAIVTDRCEQWKEKALSTNEGTSSHGNKDFLQLRVNELESKLRNEAENHQHELSTLQEVNNHTIRQYQDEIQRLQLQSPSGAGNLTKSGSSASLQKISNLTAEVDELKAKLRTKDRQLQVHKNTIEEMRSEIRQQQNKATKMETSLRESVQANEDLKITLTDENLVLQQALKDIRKAVTSGGLAVIDGDELSVGDIVQNVKALCGAKDQLQNEVDLLRQQNEAQKCERSDAVEADKESRYPVSSLPPHMSRPLFQSSPDGKRAPPSDEKFLLLPDDDKEEAEEVSSSVLGGDLTVTLAALQKQVEDYELEIAQYELIQLEWQNEKESLQTMLDRYQDELGSKKNPNANDDVIEPETTSSSSSRASAVADLKREMRDIKEARENLEKDKLKLMQEKEQLQTAALNLEEELNLSINEAQTEKDKASDLQHDLDQALAEKKRLEAALKNASDDLNSSRMEKTELDEAIEMLDAQHENEMSQLLEIRNQQNDKIKEMKADLDNAKAEKENFESTITKLQTELVVAKQQQQSHEENDASNLQEELATIRIAKEKLDEELASASEQISSLKKSLSEAEEGMLNAETEMEEANERLESVARDNEESEARIVELEKENSDLMTMLQKEAEDNLGTITAAEARVDEVVARKERLEEEQKVTLSKMEDLKREHSKVIAEMDVFQRTQKESEEEFANLLRLKDAEIRSLQEDVDAAMRKIQEATTSYDQLCQEKVRIKEELATSLKNKDEELESIRGDFSRLQEENVSLAKQSKELKRKHEDSELDLSNLLAEKDAKLQTLNSELQLLREEEKKRMQEMLKTHESDVEEGASLKNELLRLEERLASSNAERDSLKSNLVEAQKSVSNLERDLALKKSLIADLESEAKSMKSDADKKVKQGVDEYQVKMNELNAEYDDNMLKVCERHNQELRTLEETWEAKLETMSLQHDENLALLQEEIIEAGKKNEQLQQTVKDVEQEQRVEHTLISEKLQNSADSQSEIDRLQTENLSLVSALDIAQNESEAARKALKNSEEQNQKKHQEFEEATRELREEHRAATENLKSTHVKQLSDLEETHAAKLAEKISSLKQDYDPQLENLHQQVAELKTVCSECETSLAKSKSEETKLKLELNNLEALRGKEVLDLEEELSRAQEDLRTMSDHLEQKEKKWKKEIASSLEKLNAKHKLEVEKLTRDNRSSGDNDISRNPFSSDEEVLHLKEDVNHLRSEIQRMLQVEVETLEAHEAKVLELETTIEGLKSSTGKSSDISKQMTPEDIDSMLEEIRERDLSGLEKTDLTKDDIGSLLTLIKERDHVISVLRESKQTSVTLPQKGLSDVEERCNLLIEERDQMMSVISEKTRENRQLKDEAHKMADVISTCKGQLDKAQSENAALKQKYEGFDQEMTRETVARLSKLISEKDLEIESHKQKCQTLLDVLHQQEKAASSSGGSPPGGNSQPGISSQQVQSLMQDRETLSQQVRQLLTERDHLVSLVNRKHHEAALFQEHARAATEALESDAGANSRLQVDYGNLVHDFEQLEMRNAAAKREAAKLKETAERLQKSKELILSKLGEGETPSPNLSVVAPPQSHSQSRNVVKMEHLRSSEPTHQQHPGSGKTREELESILERKSESLLQKDLLLEESNKRTEEKDKEIAQLERDLREKDLLIHQKMDETRKMGADLAQKTNEVQILRKSVENLREQISTCTYEAELLREKVKSLEHNSDEKETESSAFQETNAQLSVLLKEREYEMEALKEKVASLTEILQRNAQGQDTESRRYLDELDRVKQQATSAKHERDQIMLTLKQKQLESQRANDEARMLRDKESKLASELTRLRGHLVQVEETYTQEAVLASDRERVLRKQLDQIESRSASVQEASIMSKQQMESLQEQLRAMAAHRDQVVHKFQLAQEQSSQYASALQQLQLAAERMQREEASTYAARVDKIQRHCDVKEREATALAQKVAELKAKLNDASEALESASRLNDQLEIKEQAIERMKEIVSEKQLRTEELQDQLHALNNRNEGMVDRELVRNLLVGYFGSPSNKQPDVLRLIANVIGFSKADLDRLTRPKPGWVGGWLSWGKGGSPGSKQHSHGASDKGDSLNESFTQMFVKFLEEESSSQLPPARLPASAMAQEAQQKMTQRRSASEGIPTPAFNPPRGGGREAPERSTVAGRYNPLLSMTSTSTVTSTPSTANSSGHPLMQPLTPILPTFAPMAPVKATAERDLLQGILHSEPST